MTNALLQAALDGFDFHVRLSGKRVQLKLSKNGQSVTRLFDSVSIVQFRWDLMEAEISNLRRQLELKSGALPCRHCGGTILGDADGVTFCFACGLDQQSPVSAENPPVRPVVSGQPGKRAWEFREGLWHRITKPADFLMQDEAADS